MNVFHKFAIKSLKLNRTRTIVTIIGIILSTAMLTAVTTTVSSVQRFLLEVTEKQNGCWHGAARGSWCRRGPSVNCGVCRRTSVSTARMIRRPGCTLPNWGAALCGTWGFTAVTRLSICWGGNIALCGRKAGWPPAGWTASRR